MRKKVCDGTHSQSDIPPIYHVLANHGHTATTSKKQKETYVCGKCKKAFSYARHLEKHLQGHKRNDCKDCSEMFTSRKYLSLHMREKHDKKLRDTKYSCKFCKKIFTRSCFLYTHYRVHAEGRLVCEICGDFCTDNNEYEKHLLKHEENRLSCILCHRTFARQQQYSMHMQSHDKYQCVTCKLGFPTQKLILQHKQQGHEIQMPASFTCSHCNRTFRYKASLNAHLKQHTSENALKCTTCNKTFRTSKCLTDHYATQRHKSLATDTVSSDQGYVCEHCGKHFVHQLSLNIHRSRNHTDKRIYCCDFCPHSTNFKANLSRHIRLHLNERRFVCEQCGAAFYVHSALKDHCVYIHSDVRKYQCDKCPKSFKRSSELKRHERTHSNIRPHACLNCERTFNRMSHLKRHREKFHKESVPTRQVQRMMQDETGTFQPVPKETKKSNKKTTICNADNTHLLMLPYEDVVNFKRISDDETCKEISTIGLECTQELTNTPAAHFLVTLPAQALPSSETNLIYLATTSVQSLSMQQDVDLSKSPIQLRDTEAIEILKHRHYQNSNELGSHMLLAPHEASMKNVLGVDVKLSDSMMDDVGDAQDPLPGRDSPLCMSDLVRLQEASLHDFRSQDVTRNNMNSPISSDINADHLSGLNADCASQHANQYM